MKPHATSHLVLVLFLAWPFFNATAHGFNRALVANKEFPIHWIELIFGFWLHKTLHPSAPDPLLCQLFKPTGQKC